MLSAQESISSGYLYEENAAFMRRKEWQELQSALLVANDGDYFDEDAQTFAAKEEIVDLDKEIKNKKEHLQSVYDRECVVPIKEKQAELMTKLKGLELRRNAPQEKIANIRNEITKYEAEREEQRVQLEKNKNYEIEEDIMSLDRLAKELRQLHVNLVDIQFHYNDRLLNDQITAAAALHARQKAENKDTAEIVEVLKYLRLEAAENKQQHAMKMKLVQGQTELEAEQFARDSKELARINSMQQETRTTSHEIYVNFLNAQQKRLKKRLLHHTKPEIAIEAEDLCDLLLNVGVKADNFWIAPLYMVESFVRDHDKLQEGKLRKYADHIREL
jgi:hypothetical protein